MPGNRKSQFSTFVLLPVPYLIFLNWISSLYFHFSLCYVPNGRVSAI